MLSTNTPGNVAIPFARDAGLSFSRLPPNTAQSGNAASFPIGFPPVTFAPVTAGGIPPDGRDFNGILNYITLALQYLQAGYFPAYNSVFSSQIGGYPLNHVLRSTDGQSLWRSTVENNTTNPDAGGAGWVLFGITTVFGRKGPAITAQAGDYTAAQVGAIAITDISSATSFNVNGYTSIPGGMTWQWGRHTNSADDEFVSFPVPFAHFALNVVTTIIGNTHGSFTNMQIGTPNNSGFMAHAEAQERNFFWQAIGY